MSNFRYFYNLEWYEMLKLYDYRSLSCDSNLIRCGESAFMRFMYYFFLCRSICILFIHFKCYNICKSTKKHTSESECVLTKMTYSSVSIINSFSICSFPSFILPNKCVVTSELSFVFVWSVKSLSPFST